MESYELAILLARALDSKKGGDLKLLKTEGLTTLADYFVICTATSNTHSIKDLGSIILYNAAMQIQRIHTKTTHFPANFKCFLI